MRVDCLRLLLAVQVGGFTLDLFGDGFQFEYFVQHATADAADGSLLLAKVELTLPPLPRHCNDRVQSWVLDITTPTVVGSCQTEVRCRC